MSGYFWNTVLAINSAIWFPCVGYIVYTFFMMILRGQWKQFLFALLLFAIVSGFELILNALAHD